ncbi:MAG TPA: hypothetical protein VMW01_11550 [Williamwhitmania sp.]|nr:hypothetical protein [Williamwhitmania sp.]
MKTNTESGHAKNVANFEALVTVALGYGAAYNPAKASLKIEAAQAIATNARSLVNAVDESLPLYSNAVAKREVAFKPLSKLVTRVLSALKASDVTTQVIENARTITRKIQGIRAKAKLTDEEKATLEAEGKTVTEVSASQMGFDSRLENFNKLIKYLEANSAYAPNEPELQVASLTTLYNNLLTTNAAVVAVSAPLANARIARNALLYQPSTGLVDTALDIKTYIKSLFGGASPQYRQVNKLAFKTINS